jgi:hypothetical protein
MPAAIFAAISPFPPFPAMLFLLRLAPANAPGKRNENPRRFPTISGKPPKKTTGILRETVRKNKDARIAVGIGLGAYDLENVAADSSETSKRLQRRFLPALGVFVSRARVYTRREAWGFGSVDLRCGP